MNFGTVKKIKLKKTTQLVNDESGLTPVSLDRVHGLIH